MPNRNATLPKSKKALETAFGGKQSGGVVVDGAGAAREDPRVSMVAGSCAHPECHVRRAVADALRQKQDFSRLDDGAAVTVTCTNPNCTAGGRMHATCFAKLETQLLKTLGKFSNKSDVELSKMMWTSKYDLIQKFCRCSNQKHIF